MSKGPTKEELQKRIDSLEEDVLAYATEVVTLAEEMKYLRKAFQESYNPYSKGTREISTLAPAEPPKKAPAQAKVDNSINITVTR